MRPTLRLRTAWAVLVVTAGLILTTLPATGAAPVGSGDDGRDVTGSAAARRTLAVADRVLSGEATRTDPSATMALLDLWRSREALGTVDRRRADALLARPTDGASDPYGFGYTGPSRKRCAKNVCVHWVIDPADVDAPPSSRWVDQTLRTAQRTWKAQTGKLKYRKPLGDGKAGGNGKLDVYLKDVGSFGLYGFCAPERRVQRFLASGFCVLDDDFASAQFGAPPATSMKVTAAHEIFHAVQFAYDAFDDQWAMEASATWMEEVLVDGANDNRQYFPTSPLQQPWVSMDYAAAGSTNQYGQWVFFEFLSRRYGRDVVRRIWTKMGAFKGAPDKYSLTALSSELQHRGGFTRVFTEFAAANTIPRKTYREGRAWPAAPVTDFVLGKHRRSTGAVRATHPHLSASSIRVRPDHTLSRKSWRLKVRIRGPQRKTGPGAHVVVDLRRGGVERRYVPLSRKGEAVVTVPFSRKRVSSVTVTVANASTRYRCFRQTEWACQGVPRDDHSVFTVKAKLLT